MKLGKKLLIVLGVLVVLVGAVFFIFHDDADVEAIEKEQDASAEASADEGLDALSSDLENFEDVPTGQEGDPEE